ncbi:MAG: cell division topological specificity factor MinE [Syntrophomonadaceae bacterium]|jgi:cell division topological specificity factor
MLNFLKRFDAKNPRNRANERLKDVLVHDRLNTSSAQMDNLKEEVIKVISKHLEVSGKPEVTIISDGRRPALDINIPLKGR